MKQSYSTRVNLGGAGPIFMKTNTVGRSPTLGRMSQSCALLTGERHAPFSKMRLIARAEGVMSSALFDSARRMLYTGIGRVWRYAK